MYDSSTLSNLSYYRARISASKEAVYDYDHNRRYSYGELEERAQKLAWFLTHKLGLCKGDRIGFCANNSISFVDAFYASCKTGIIITTYNCLLRANELVSMIENEDPRVIFYSGAYRKIIDTMHGAAGNREFISLDGRAASERYCYDDIMNCLPTHEIIEIEHEPDDVQMLIHTGGTTGMPKAAMLTYRSLFYNAISEILTVQLTDRDCAFVYLPFFHTAAWNVLTMPLLMAGGRIIISDKFHPKKALHIIQTERPTVAMAVEMIYKALLAQPEFAVTDFSCFRWMLSGAAPISKVTLEAYLSRSIKLVNAYGMTEAGPNNLVPPVNDMTVAEIRNKWNSAGMPMYFNHIRIVDKEGNDLPQGQRGELIWKSNLCFSGYWKNPQATEETIKDGWVHSGDIGYCDQDGFYYICGRIKNMYISGGENIFPIEIEEVCQEHPNVIEACVIGVPDERWGEVGKALLVIRSDSDVERQDIKHFINQNISSIKRPKYIEFISCISKNAVGKRDMPAILKQYGQ